MEFPRTVYVKGPGMEVVGGMLTPLLVCNEEEHKAALRGGYFPSVPEALAEKLNEPLVEQTEEEQMKEEQIEEAPLEVVVKKQKKANLKLSIQPVYE